MNLQINSNGLNITSEVKDTIQKKFVEKIDLLLANFNEEMKTADLHIEFDQRYKKYIVKFDMKLPGSDGQIFSQTTHHDLIAAIIDLREQVEKQIKKYKAEFANYSIG